MKFPGRRKTKHYFPVDHKTRDSLDDFVGVDENIYVVGIDQLLVDIEIHVSDEFLAEHNFPKGQSFIVDDELAEKIYWEFKNNKGISGEFPGGAVGNTLHNYSVLSDGKCVALGTINKNITVGDYAYKYLCKTSGIVDLSFLQPCEKPMGKALCFITPDMERTFAISKGCMNELSPESIPSTIVANASVLLLSAYTLRDHNSPIFEATIKACEIAKQNNVPVIISLGTSSLVAEKIDYLKEFLERYVSIVAMNQEEAIALTDIDDPLLAAEAILDTVDMALITVGKKGLYLGGHCCEQYLRPTKEPLHTKSIVEYNKYEYSRPMRKINCSSPVKIYSHINPFKGGPSTIKNTNGAGDAALSAIIHDIAANDWHRLKVPNSPKHEGIHLSYSSLSQICKYCNRASFEVLSQNSPRLIRSLPQKEDSLEEAYWRK